ncbi:MAG: DUF1990 family protein [Solirubrobacteraceae bacterium]
MDERLAGPPRVRRKLAKLARRKLNFELAALADATPASGWNITDVCEPLPVEAPGMPVQHGSWEIARRLMGGYEFADPSIVRAYYDPDTPLARRDILLKLQALGVVHLFVGVRVGEVYEQTTERDGRRAHIWGWNYRTLEGHVEIGQMDWEVWKWLDSGEVEFRIHAVSRPAQIPNPLVRMGFRVLRRHERNVFLDSTKRRMRKLTELALQDDPRARPDPAAVTKLTIGIGPAGYAGWMPRRFPIVQFPNPPLVAAILAALLARTVGGAGARNAAVLSRLALLVWACGEVTGGANWFRRSLGLAGGTFSGAGLLRSWRSWRS